MNVDKLTGFKEFVDKEILLAAAELERLEDRSRRHLQKLVYTNLVDRFDSMIDAVLLDNCREDLLVTQASRNLTQQVTEADLVRLLLDATNVQVAIETKVKDALRNSVLRDRHSKKLRVLFEVFQHGEGCWSKPRVNIATGEIYSQMTPQRQNIPYSICGYADWLYARRNAIVHGSGATSKLLPNDVQQLKKLFQCVPAKSVSIKPATVKIGAKFYNSVIHLLTS